ncbi:MAG: hypothetical protein KKB31_05335 [Nanoarchaeota archaeon]|nr:hypothetical protein [Nanoarchaeota archaeon]
MKNKIKENLKTLGVAILACSIPFLVVSPYLIDDIERKQRQKKTHEEQKICEERQRAIIRNIHKDLLSKSRLYSDLQNWEIYLYEKDYGRGERLKFDNLRDSVLREVLIEYDPNVKNYPGLYSNNYNTLSTRDYFNGLEISLNELWKETYRRMNEKDSL